MTNREFLELKEKLKKATNRELGEIFVRMRWKDPFKEAKNHLILPSVIREKAIEQIEKWFRAGHLTAKKDG
jgi:hypothetical protein